MHMAGQGSHNTTPHDPSSGWPASTAEWLAPSSKMHPAPPPPPPLTPPKANAAAIPQKAMPSLWSPEGRAALPPAPPPPPAEGSVAQPLPPRPPPRQPQGESPARMPPAEAPMPIFTPLVMAPALAAAGSGAGAGAPPAPVVQAPNTGRESYAAMCRSARGPPGRMSPEKM